jgi:alkylation response protein AidB-like acyl-CoA dehydrogenase
MGIKASATCVMNFDQAEGYLVGEANKGLAAMFTMMNYERLSIGLQGIGCAEASYQAAARYANERLQSRAPRQRRPLAQRRPDHRARRCAAHAADHAHPHRGGRAFAVYVGQQLDIARYAEDAGERERAQRQVALLTPVAKAFFTDNGLESCVLGQQVFGGHGYIREWGQEQRVRDVRIAQIYEGTNGIQALDLLGRKVLGDGGQALAGLVAEIRAFAWTPRCIARRCWRHWCAWSASASGCRHRPARMPTWSAPRRWSTCTCSA